jgi:hypothetical protein
MNWILPLPMLLIAGVVALLPLRRSCAGRRRHRA